jgi:hypothetical protein
MIISVRFLQPYRFEIFSATTKVDLTTSTCSFLLIFAVTKNNKNDIDG